MVLCGFFFSLKYTLLLLCPAPTCPSPRHPLQLSLRHVLLSSAGPFREEYPCPGWVFLERKEPTGFQSLYLFWSILMDAPTPQGMGGGNLSYIVSPIALNNKVGILCPIDGWKSRQVIRSLGCSPRPGQLSVCVQELLGLVGFPTLQVEVRASILRGRDRRMRDPRKQCEQGCGGSTGVGQEGRRVSREEPRMLTGLDTGPESQTVVTSSLFIWAGQCV